MILAAVLFAAAASAPTAPPVTPVGATAAPSPAVAANSGVDPNKKVCRAEVITGTHMMTRVCHTQAEWDQMQLAGQATADRMLRDSAVNTGR